MNIKKIVGTTAVVAILAGVAITVYPQRNAVATDGNRNTPIGSWKIIVTPDSGPEGFTFTNFAAFTSDGQVINSNHTGLAAVGLWERMGDHRYAVTFTGIGEMNDEMMLYKIRSMLEPADGGERLVGPFVTQFYDLGGNHIFDIQGTVDGTRIPLEPLE